MDDAHSWGAVSAPSTTAGAVRASAAHWGEDWVDGGDGDRDGLQRRPGRPRVRPEEVGMPSVRPARRPANAPGKTPSALETLQREALGKAQALEEELARYQADNAALRQLRRQQEGLVTDLTQQRAEVLRTIGVTATRCVTMVVVVL